MRVLNHLSEETSPYLLQHAYNPVDWYPWGEKALQKARYEDKPILVSIGYSACHWCHVMEKESFEDEETAQLMNKYFVNIKIDREERPDLDHIYMDAVQAIAGAGGWPLNVFLTPDCKPFYGGTYFPPQRAFNKPSWKEVLSGVYQLFTDKRQEIESQAEELTQHIGKSSIAAQLKNTIDVDGKEIFSWREANLIFENIINQADKVWGGFGNAPKFPQTFTIKYLLRYYHYTKNENALKYACLSLDKMLYGGIYDHIGGGFARYSTDAQWLAPHFEKMLYDNALIISTLCDAYQLTRNKRYKDTVGQTIDFIKRELMNDEGGFYSALDADSEGEEGKYYVWSFEEIKEILENDAGLFCEFYDISPQGNWEHKNILRVLIPAPEFAKTKSINEAEFEAFLKACAEKLLQARGKRVRPQLDDKILLGWNALMNIALSKAAVAFEEASYKELAVKNIKFLLLQFAADKGLMHHTFKNGIAKYPAFLDDYAYLIKACIQLQEVTSEQTYLQNALLLIDTVIENFGENINDHFHYTGKKQEDVIIRKKEIYDGAIPSGNSVMAANLFYLSMVFNKKEWKERAIKMLNDLSEMIIKYPTSFANWACILIDQAALVNEIAIIGKDFIPLRDELLSHFIPNKILQSTEISSGNEFPLLSNKTALQEPLVYLCRNYSCSSPQKNLDMIIDQIASGINFKDNYNN
ncbi:MAG: thioredoxin domain-containing protein [Ginsengibacter sp.]